jgi:hypothetical protein
MNAGAKVAASNSVKDAMEGTRQDSVAQSSMDLTGHDFSRAANVPK